MVKCPSCGKSHPENTLFCDECGAYLLAEGYKRTDSLGVEESDWIETDFGVVDSFESTSVKPMTIRLAILETGRQVELPMHKEANIGRLDPSTATFPDLDLTEDQGQEKGVSRRHAKITRKGAMLFLEDLGSVNGTYLNGKRLTPYLPHSLKNEDEIRLGKMRLRIYF